jgi:hypothetical protein
MWETAIDPQFQTKKKKKNQPNNQTYFALSGVQKTELGYKAQISRVIGRGKHITEEEKRRLNKPGMKSMPFSIFLNSSTTRRKTRKMEM